MKRIVYSLGLSLIAGTVILISLSIKPKKAEAASKGFLNSTLVGLYEVAFAPCGDGSTKTLGDSWTNTWVSEEGDVYDCSTALGQTYINTNHSAFGKVMSYSDTLYTNPPSSAIAWFEYEKDKIQGNNTAFAQEAYRPGLGYSLLQPIQGIWAWMRNVTYLMYIVVIIIISFLILFRKRLGGQTPITLFSSIPSIILSLILITFSYTISAFFVDIITIGTNLTQNLMLSGPGAPGQSISTSKKDQLQPDDPDISVWKVMKTSGVSLAPCDDKNPNCELQDLLPANEVLEAMPMIGGIVTTFMDALQKIGGDDALVKIIMAFSALMVSVKMFMTLLNKYLVLVIGPILSPFYFFLAGFPTKTESYIMLFLRTHLGASFTFIAVYAWFLLIVVLGDKFAAAGNVAPQLVPPLMGYSQSLFGSGEHLAGNIIVFALFLGTPAIPEFVNKLFDVPDSNMFARQVGQRISGGAKTATSLATGVLGFTGFGQKLNQAIK